MRIPRGILIASLVCAAPAHADQPPPPPDTHVASAASLGPDTTMEAACASPEAACKPKKLKKAKLAAPYLGLGLAERNEHGLHREYLGIRTDTGWHLFTIFEWGEDYGGTGSLKVTSVKVKDVIPGGAPEILVAGTRKTSNESSSYQRYGTKEELLWVCGVGASNAPSCAEVVLARDVKPSDTDEEATRYKFKLSHKWTADGRLTRKVKGKWPKHARDFEGPIDRAQFENTWGFLFP